MTLNALAETATVLLVEDDEALRREMAGYLDAQGYAVRQAPPWPPPARCWRAAWST
jgi:two-component system OmpR family response regulator